MTHVKVKVEAGAKHEKVERVSDTFLKISVKEPAERGLANERVRELVAIELSVNLNKVRIVNGRLSPSKLVAIAE